MTTTDYTEPAVPLGQHRMPLLGFGTWQIENEDAPQATTTALELGYRHIDTATGYGNESGIGSALADSGLDRDAVFLTTKLPPEHVGRERRTIEESLTKLGVDHVDLWLVHWPPNKQASPEVWAEVIKAQQDGLATNIGVSNYSLAQIDELIAATGVAPAVNQIQWSPGIYDATVASRAGRARRRPRGLQPVQGQQPGRPDPGPDRRSPRRHRRPGDRGLARGARFRGDSQVGAPGADRGQCRRCAGRADRRRGRRHRRSRRLREGQPPISPYTVATIDSSNPRWTAGRVRPSENHVVPSQESTRFHDQRERFVLVAGAEPIGLAAASP